MGKCLLKLGISLALILVLKPAYFSVFAAEEPLTLEEAIGRALKSNPDILQAEQEVAAVRGLRLQMGALPWPDLVFSREGMGVGPKKGEVEVSLGLQQLIEFPGKRALRREIGSHAEAAALSRLEAVKRRVVSRVKRAFALTGLAQETLSYYRSLLELLDEGLKTARTRYEAGEVPYLDVLRFDLERLKIQNEIIGAEKDLEEKWAELNLLLGGELLEREEVVVDLNFEPLGQSLSTLLQEIKERPALAALRQAVEQAEAEVSLVRKSILPDIRVGFFYPSLRSSSWGFGLETSLPLWRTQQKGAMEQALARRKAAEISLEFRQRKIAAAVTTIYNRLQSLERRLSLFQNSLLQEAESLLRLAISQYGQGKVGFLDLFEVYRMTRETRFAYLQALFEYRVALAELEVAGESESAGVD